VADTWHEDVIDIVHARLNELLPAPLPYLVNKKPGEHECHPLVVWTPAPNGGKITGVKSAGGNPAPIGLDTCQYLVTIWHSNRANCRATLHNLVVAARASAAKSSVRIGTRYDFPRDAHADAGVVLVATCEVEVVVTNAITPFVEGEDLEVTAGIYDESVEPPELVASDTIPPVT
jgi:hypothetical protein